MWTINQFPKQSIGSKNLTVDSLLPGRDSRDKSRPHPTLERVAEPSFMLVHDVQACDVRRGTVKSVALVHKTLEGYRRRNSTTESS